MDSQLHLRKEVPSFFLVLALSHAYFGASVRISQTWGRPYNVASPGYVGPASGVLSTGGAPLKTRNSVGHQIDIQLGV